MNQRVYWIIFLLLQMILVTADKVTVLKIIVHQVQVVLLMMIPKWRLQLTIQVIIKGDSQKDSDDHDHENSNQNNKDKDTKTDSGHAGQGSGDANDFD